MSDNGRKRHASRSPNTTRVCVARVRQWGQWLPLDNEPAHPNMQVINGDVQFEVPDDVTLHSFEAQMVPNAVKHVPVTGPDGKSINIRTSLVMFQAVLTHYEYRDKKNAVQGKEAKEEGPKIQLPPGFSDKS